MVFSRKDAHTPFLPALPHGGLAQAKRRQTTPFGSGWRGIFAIPDKYVKLLLGSESVAGRAMSAKQLAAAAQNMRLNLYAMFDPQAKKLISELNAAEAYTKKTGFLSVAVHGGLSGTELRTTIRHERLHSIWLKNKDHPELARFVKEAPPLETSLAGVGMELDEARQHIKLLQKRGVELEERFTHGYESSRSIRPRLRAAGLELPEMANRALLRASRGSSTAPGLSMPAATGSRVTSKSL